MEKILTDTKDIYPEFWNRYWCDTDNLKFQSKYNSCELETTISKIFDLLVFLISNIRDIFLNNCDRYLDILNMLCIYSVISREINLILVKNIKDKIVLTDILKEFIEITSIIVNTNDEAIILLRNENTEDSNKLFNDKIISSKSKAKDLFLKILKYI